MMVMMVTALPLTVMSHWPLQREKEIQRERAAERYRKRERKGEMKEEEMRQTLTERQR